MYRFKALLLGILAVAAIGAIGAGSASAATATGTIQGTAAGEVVGPCNFSVDYTGTPPADVAFDGGTFVLDPAVGCDSSDITVTDFTGRFSGSFNLALGGSPYASGWSITALVDLPFLGPTPCTFPVSSGSVSGSGASLTGPYGLTGSSGSSSCFVSAALSVSNLQL